MVPQHPGSTFRQNTSLSENFRRWILCKPEWLCLLYLNLKILLAFSKLSSSVGGFLWLPGCRNFFTVGRLLTLVFRACNAQEHSSQCSPGPACHWHKPGTRRLPPDQDQPRPLPQHQEEAGHRHPRRHEGDSAVAFSPRDV